MNKFTKKLAQAAVAVAITIGTVGGSAGTASAAGGTAPDVRACFKYSATSAYRGPASLYRWTGSTWSKIRSATTNAYGCVQFNDVMPNRAYAVTAYKQTGTAASGIFAHDGATGWGYTQSGYDRLLNLGTAGVAVYQISGTLDNPFI